MSAATNLDRRRFLTNVAVTVGAVPLAIAGCAIVESPGALRLPSEGEFPSLSGATVWLNSQPLTTRGLRRSVVLVNSQFHSAKLSERGVPIM